MSPRPGRQYRPIAAFYDPESAGYPMLQEDIAFFLSRLPGRRLSILELAAGTGRAAIPIAQMGHRVVGVDRCPEMLTIAQRKRDAAGLGKHEVELIEGDVLECNLSRRFDVVCIFFNTFLTFVTLEEQDQALGAIRRHLKRGGRFWIDIFNPDFQLLAEPIRRDLDPRIFRVAESQQTVQRLTDVRQGRDPQVQHLTFRYTWIDEKGKEHRRKRDFDLTFLMPRELQILLERNGLKSSQMWGDYDGTPLLAGSPRIICQGGLGP